MDADDPNARGNSRRHIIEQCEASLRRLQTDYIDLYQLHRPQADIPMDETLRALDDLVRAGKVRYIGTSTFAAWEIFESLWAAKEFGLNRVVCEQPPYNLLDRRAERELLPMTQTFGIGVIPWGPLGGGLLTGKYRRGEPLPEDGRYATNPQQARRLTEGVYDVVEGLEPIAAEKGCTLSQLALAWCEQQPGVTSPNHRAAHPRADRGQPRRERGHDHRRGPGAHRCRDRAGAHRLALLRGRLAPARVPDPLAGVPASARA